MKDETLIVVVALLLVGIIIVKNTVSKSQETTNNTVSEANKVAYRYDIEDQNFTDINQNIIEPSDNNEDLKNVIDVSDIEELRRESGN